MKKSKLTLTMATIFCMATLTGCSANMTVENIASGTQSTQTTASEVQSAPTQSSTAATIENQVQAEPSDEETYTLSFEYKIEESTGKEYAVVSVDGSLGTHWSYETSKFELGQYSRVEHLSSPAYVICFNEGGTVTALDAITGNVLWKNAEYNGGGSISTVDENGNLYIAAGEGPALMIIDSNGNTLHKVDSFGDYFWPVTMTLENDVLTITFDSDDNARVTVDINDYSYTIH